MDRAARVALKMFPLDNFDGDIGDSLRAACTVGYIQAMHDLALTWEDVAIIITLYEQGIDNGDYQRYNEAEWMKEYSQDILRKFNEIRKK